MSATVATAPAFDKPAADIISRAISWLVLNHPWFAALALRLRLAQDTSGAIPTAAVDGVTLVYNPAFVLPLPKSHVRGLVAHEVMHCALRHMTRRGSRDPKLWNTAADHVINLQLVAAGFDLPAGALCDRRFADMSTEQAYALLREENPNGAPDGPPDPLGEVRDAPSGAPSKGKGDGKGEDGGNDPSDGAGNDTTTPEQIEAEWDKAVEQATMMAKRAGKVPGGTERTIGAARSDNNWRAVVEQYFTVRDDYAWSRPNRRFIGQGIYLPGTAITRVRHIVIAVDTSGSVSPSMLAAFSAECAQVMATAGRPERTTVLYCDTRINREEEFDASDCDDFSLRACGGGGTAFNPVFDHVGMLPEPPDVLFYLTDLDCYDRPQDPGCPVIWVTPEWVTRDGGAFGFGDTVRVNVEA